MDVFRLKIKFEAPRKPGEPVSNMVLFFSTPRLKGDNYDGTLASVFMIVILANCSYIYTYGGDFRKCVLHNLGNSYRNLVRRCCQVSSIVR